MKMPDGSFYPAYNFQYAVDTSTTMIVGTDVLQAGTDGGQILPMYNRIKELYRKQPKRYLADGGFKNKDDVEILEKEKCEVYMPPQQHNKKGEAVKDIDKSRRGESPEVGAWRIRMSKEESKEIYKRRSSTIELVNARLRKYGLYRLHIRGLDKAKGIANMFAIAHNMSRIMSLSMH